MTPSGPAFIHPFMHSGNATDGLIRMSAHFDAEAFAPSLFQEYSLHCPRHIAEAVNKRQAEYFAGRWLARQALNQFGHAHFALLSDAKRCPLWPLGLVGSITHSTHQVRCAVGCTNHYRALGIDIQTSLSTPAAEKLQGRILSRDEVRVIEQHPLPRATSVALCFSAKESIYKALYPIVKRYFGFASAELYAIDTQAATLQLSIALELAALPGCPREVCAHYHLSDDQVYTEVMLQ